MSDIAPKAAVILIGANNLGRVHWSAEDTVTGIDTIIDELHKRLPKTKILLLGVLPSDLFGVDHQDHGADQQDAGEAV